MFGFFGPQANQSSGAEARDGRLASRTSERSQAAGFRPLKASKRGFSQPILSAHPSCPNAHPRGNHSRTRVRTLWSRKPLLLPKTTSRARGIFSPSPGLAKEHVHLREGRLSLSSQCLPREAEQPYSASHRYHYSVLYGLSTSLGIYQVYQHSTSTTVERRWWSDHCRKLQGFPADFAPVCNSAAIAIERNVCVRTRWRCEDVGREGRRINAKEVSSVHGMDEGMTR